MSVEVIDARVASEAPRYVTGLKRGQRRAYRAPRRLPSIDSIGLHHLGPGLSAEPEPGQTLAERAETIHAIRKSHKEFGHIQEVIVQNFRAKDHTAMAAAPDAGFDDFLATVAVALAVGYLAGALVVLLAGLGSGR